jgi:Zn-dependent peptidase ImmA (M78 family)
VETAEKEATALLKSLSDEGMDISVPIDPILIAKRLGIVVVETELKSDVSAEIRKEVGADPRIILNVSDSRTRKRFSCAHELGHYIQHIRDESQPDEKFSWVDKRGPLASTGSNPQEIFANQFAAALLMPKEEVDSRVGSGVLVADLATVFGVSLEAMKYRLINLGHATP